MNSPEPKKLALLRILQILKKYSDEKHPLTQAEIIEKLRDYEIELERKSVGKNIDLLIKAGIDIQEVPNKGVYLASRKFSDEDLRILIDSVMFSRNIDDERAGKLIEKLESGIGHGKKFYSTIHKVGGFYHADIDVFAVMDKLNDAIANGVQVSFMYNDYGNNKQLHHAWQEAAVVNPYYVIAFNNSYYLIGNVDKFDNLGNFRLDKMTDVAVLESPRKNIRYTSEQSLDLGKYMSAHPFMEAGKADRVYAYVKNGYMSRVIDAFGKKFDVLSEDSEGVKVAIFTGEEDAYLWALQNADCVEIVSPQPLRNRLRQTVSALQSTYIKNDTDKYYEAIENYKNSRAKVLWFSQIKAQNKIIYEDLSEARQIELRDTDITDISFIGYSKSKLINLKVLVICRCDITDISPAMVCPALENLAVEYTKVANIDCLRSKKFESLSLVGNPIDDYSPLYEVQGLKHLSLGSSDAQKVDAEKLRSLYPDIEINIVKERAARYMPRLDGFARRRKYPYNLLNEITVRNNCTFILDITKLESKLQNVFDSILSKEETEVIVRIYQKGHKITKIASDWQCDKEGINKYLQNALARLTAYDRSGGLDEIKKFNT